MRSSRKARWTTASTSSSTASAAWNATARRSGRWTRATASVKPVMCAAPAVPPPSVRKRRYPCCESARRCSSRSPPPASCASTASSCALWSHVCRATSSPSSEPREEKGAGPARLEKVGSRTPGKMAWTGRPHAGLLPRKGSEADARKSRKGLCAMARRFSQQGAQRRSRRCSWHAVRRHPGRETRLRLAHAHRRAWRSLCAVFTVRLGNLSHRLRLEAGRAEVSRRRERLLQRWLGILVGQDSATQTEPRTIGQAKEEALAQALIRN